MVWLNRIVLVLLTAAVFILSWLTPCLSDDFMLYAKLGIRPGQEPGFLAAAASPDFWCGCWDYVARTYMTWGGRYAAWAITYPLNFLQRWVFASANAAMWSILSVAFCRLAGADRWRRSLVYLSVFVFGLQDEAVLWMTGSFSYLCAFTPAVAVGVYLTTGKARESVGMREWWRPVGLFLVGFLAVGGHELVAMTTGTVLGALWLRRWLCGCRRMSRGLVVSFGCWFGMMVCVLAPGNFVRAATMASRRTADVETSLPFALKMKLLEFSHVVQDNPTLLLFALVLLAVVLNSRWRRRVSQFDWLLAFATIVNLTLVMVLTDGSVARVGWFAKMLSLLVVLRFVVTAWKNRPLVGTVHALLAFSAGLVFLQTLITTGRRANLFAETADSIERSEDGCVRGDYLEVRNQSWFDRAASKSFEWGAPADLSVAWTYGRDNLIVLDGWSYDNVYLRDAVTGNPTCRLPHVKDWFAHPEHDVLVGRCPDATLKQGQSVVVRPVYDKSGITPIDRMSRWAKLKANVRMALRLGMCEWTHAMPWQEVIADVPMRGIVLRTGHGSYYVVRHNHHIDRGRILKLEVEVPAQ